MKYKADSYIPISLMPEPTPKLGEKIQAETLLTEFYLLEGGDCLEWGPFTSHEQARRYADNLFLLNEGLQVLNMLMFRRVDYSAEVMDKRKETTKEFLLYGQATIIKPVKIEACITVPVKTNPNIQFNTKYQSLPAPVAGWPPVPPV